MTRAQIRESLQTKEGLTRQRNCAVFLGSPADMVLVEAVAEIERLRAKLEAHGVQP